MKISKRKFDINFEIRAKTEKKKSNEIYLKTEEKESLCIFPASSFGILFQGRKKNVSFGTGKNVENKDFYKRYKDEETSETASASINRVHTERMSELVKSGAVAASDLSFFSVLSDKHYSKALTLAKSGISSGHILELAREDKIDKYYDRYIQLADNGYEGELIPEIADLTEEEFKRADFVRQSLISTAGYNPDDAHVIAQCAKLDNKKFKKVETLLNAEMTNIENIHTLALSKNSIYEKALELFNDGFEEEGLLETASLKGERLRKAEFSVRKYNTDNYTAYEASAFDEEAFSRFCDLKHRGIENLGAGYTYLVKLPHEIYSQVTDLLDEGYDYEEIFGHCFDDSDIRSSIYTASCDSYRNKLTWNNFTENCENSERYLDKLNSKDIFFLKHNAFDSPYYKPEEYIDAFIYMKNLKTKKGKRVLNCEEFYEKTSKYKNAKSASVHSDKLLYHNIKQVLSVNPSSKEASYLQTLFELIEDGTINSTPIRVLGHKPEKGEHHAWCISQNMQSDIDLLYSSIAENCDKNNLKKEIEERYVPSYKNKDEALKKTKTGDAFLIDGECYIRIKTDDNSAEEMKISKETYIKLFPPVDRYAHNQQVLGDCYCIETLMSVYGDENTRANIIRLFEEDDNGNITVNFEGYKPCLFKKGEFPGNKNTFSNGADGFKYIEYAYGKTLIEDEINNAKKRVSDEDAERIEGFVKRNPDNFFIYEKNGKPEIMTYLDALITGIYKQAKFPGDNKKIAFAYYEEFLIGNGGTEIDVLKKIGMNPVLYYRVNPFLSDDIPRAKTEKDFINIGGEKGKLFHTEDFSELYTLTDFFEKNNVQLCLDSHAYSLEQDKKNQDKYYLYNPHSQGFPVVIENLPEFFEKYPCNFMVTSPKKS